MPDVVRFVVAAAREADASTKGLVAADELVDQCSGRSRIAGLSGDRQLADRDGVGGKVVEEVADDLVVVHDDEQRSLSDPLLDRLVGKESDGALRLLQELEHAGKVLQASVTNLHRIPLAYPRP
jgi:hypothetical protein